MKKEKLKELILSSAWQLVAESGLKGLNARKLAEMSGCATGSIYNVFGGLEEIQLHVKAKVLSGLFEKLTDIARLNITKQSPFEALMKDIGLAYIDYGKQNAVLWKMVFETYPKDPVPSWYLEHAQRGIYELCDLVSRAFGIEDIRAKEVVGFFWTTVHGMSEILLNQKLEVVDQLFQKDYLIKYIDVCIDGILNDEEKTQTPQEILVNAVQ